MNTNEYSLKQWDSVTQKLLKALDSIDFNKGLEDFSKKEIIKKIRTLNRTILTEVIDAEIKSKLKNEKNQKDALNIFTKYLQDML